MNYSDELYHHGIKGQRWGVRRYQNPDGTLTAAGKKKRTKELNKEFKKMTDKFQDQIYSDDNRLGRYYKTGNETTDEIHIKVRQDAAKEAIKKIQKEYGNEVAKDVLKYEKTKLGQHALALTGVMAVSLAVALKVGQEL